MLINIVREIEHMEHDYEEDKPPRRKLLETCRTQSETTLQDMERINRPSLQKKREKISMRG